MNEFTHYQGCRGDKDNCSACALLNAGSEGPNYAAWPLSFLKAKMSIPYKYWSALAAELKRTDNPAYVDNLKQQLDEAGFQWRKL